MSKSMILNPRMSEKTYALSESLNTYVFNVPKEANRFSVADAVTSQYGVKVIKVRIANIPGKSKKSYKKRGRALPIHRNGISKAFVTLAEGDKLSIFANVEAENQTTVKDTK